MRVDQIVNRAFDAGMRQHLDDEVPFPFAISLILPMLDRAAAANSEMRAKWFDTLGAWRHEMRKLTPVGMAVRWQHIDYFAAERVGHVNRLAAVNGDAVAEVSYVMNDEAFGHSAAPRAEEELGIAVAARDG